MKRNISRDVRSVLSDSDSIKFGIPEFQVLLESKNSRCHRITWLFIILAFGSICCYQIKDRIDYYFRYEVVVDTALEKIGSLTNFKFKLCRIEFGLLREFGGNAEANSHHMKFDPKVHLTSISNVTVTHKNRSVTHINTDRLPTEFEFWGTCSVVGLDDYIGDDVVIVPREKKITYGMFKDKLVGRFVIKMQGLGEFFWKMEARKYNRISTPPNPCISLHEFENCYENCVITVMANQSQCRMFFYPEEIRLPPCQFNDVMKVAVYYGKMLFKYSQINFQEHCTCTKVCNGEYFTVDEYMLKTYPKPLVPEFKLKVEEIAITMTERIAYTKTDIVIDAAGNIGLYLGLAVLSILEITLDTARMIKKRLTINRRQNRFLYQEIRKIWMKNCCQREAPLSDTFFFKTVRILNSIKWLFFACTTVFLIYDRTVYYFSRPVRLTTEIDLLSRAMFPSVTFCGPSIKISEMKLKMAKINSYTSACQLELLDLMDYEKNITTEEIWKLSLTDLKGININTHNDVNLDRIQPNTSVIATPAGNCYNFNVDKNKEPYRGQFTRYELFFLNKDLKFYNCGLPTYLAYSGVVESDSFNILTEKIFEFAGKDVYQDYRIKTISRLNTPFQPCVKKLMFKECRERCLLRHYQIAQLCRLPFMSNNSDLTSCNSSTMAKASLKQAKEILLQLSNGRMCHCVHPCSETMFSETYYRTKTPKDYFLVTQEMTRNVVERIIEIDKYSIIALLCDVGNVVGIFLGVSVLTVLHYFQVSVSRVKKYYVKRVK